MPMMNEERDLIFFKTYTFVRYNVAITCGNEAQQNSRQGAWRCVRPAWAWTYGV